MKMNETLLEKYATIARHTVNGGDVVFSSFIADRTRVTAYVIG
jgi:hypothetical protein